jgi:hypothetical protein
MAWFSPVKGAYPSLAQVDKTLPLKVEADGTVSDAVKKVVRGTVLHETADGTFALGAEAGNTYISLQNYEDTQAEFAGGTWFGNGKTDIENATRKPGTPAVTGLSMTMAGEYETDNYKGLDITVGTKLTAGDDGVIASTSDATKAFAICTSAPTARWVNNAEVTQGYGASRRQGASVSVIRFKTI